MNKRLSYEEAIESRQGSLFDTTLYQIVLKYPSYKQNIWMDAFGNEGGAPLVDDSKELFFKFGKVIDPHIVRHAMNRNKNFTFDKIHKAMVGIPSVSDYSRIGRCWSSLYRASRKGSIVKSGRKVINCWETLLQKMGGS